VSQRQLLADVWGPGYQDETNYLRIYLARLRRKLEVEPSRPRHLITEPGMGIGSRSSENGEQRPPLPRVTVPAVVRRRGPAVVHD
jgi:two-component system KDP operon response regulator KdpE